MTFWTIIGTGLADVEGKSFGVTLDTDIKAWTASGPSVGLFFSVKSGSYAVVGVPEIGVQLVTSPGKEAAFFHDLTGTSAVGASGEGRANGTKFRWKLDSK